MSGPRDDDCNENWEDWMADLSRQELSRPPEPQAPVGNSAAKYWYDRWDQLATENARLTELAKLVRRSRDGSVWVDVTNRWEKVATLAKQALALTEPAQPCPGESADTGSESQ